MMVSQERLVMLRVWWETDMLDEEEKERNLRMVGNLFHVGGANGLCVRVCVVGLPRSLRAAPVWIISSSDAGLTHSSVCLVYQAVRRPRWESHPLTDCGDKALRLSKAVTFIGRY